MTIKKCSRCGANHRGIILRKLTRACDDYDHFAMCPTLDEPILVKVESA